MRDRRIDLLLHGILAADRGDRRRVVALRERDRAPLSGHWPLAVGVALLMASLGCVRVGIASIVGVAVGIVVGRASMRAQGGDSVTLGSRETLFDSGVWSLPGRAISTHSASRAR